MRTAAWSCIWGFDIGDQSLPEDGDVRVVELPVVEVASALHRGPLHDISETYEAVVRWIDDHGYRIADRGRELTIEWDPQDPAQNIVELQLPIGREGGLGDRVAELCDDACRRVVVQHPRALGCGAFASGADIGRDFA
jgi:hypothetical protein